jgi:hypothetical protein
VRDLDAGGRSTEEEALQALVPEVQDRHASIVTRNVSGCNRLTAGYGGSARREWVQLEILHFAQNDADEIYYPTEVKDQ